MPVLVRKHDQAIHGEIRLNSSKSESNRALIIQALGSGIELHNLSNARDTETMQRVLTHSPETWDVLDAGTTMRFCTAYLALRGAEHEITGTERMKQRPIRLLVDALKELGATIHYLEKDGFPPMRISRIIEQNVTEVRIPGHVSSQYISALLMISPALPKGLTIHLDGEIFSLPYILMTLNLMVHFGVEHTWTDQSVSIQPQSYQPQSYTIEGDWSGASYWYSIVAMNPGSRLLLKTLKSDSLQGDQEIFRIMENLGVETTFKPEGALLTHNGNVKESLELDFKKCPDLAQTVMVTASILGVSLTMTGLESLKIKETDRIYAMTEELKKIGGTLEEKDHVWYLRPGTVPETIDTIATYEDHRMAMAFAPVAMIRDVAIEDPEVVNKSYPGFWEDLGSLDIKTKQL